MHYISEACVCFSVPSSCYWARAELTFAASWCWHASDLFTEPQPIRLLPSPQSPGLVQSDGCIQQEAGLHYVNKAVLRGGSSFTLFFSPFLSISVFNLTLICFCFSFSVFSLTSLDSELVSILSPTCFYSEIWRSRLVPDWFSCHVLTMSCWWHIKHLLLETD